MYEMSSLCRSREWRTPSQMLPIAVRLKFARGRERIDSNFRPTVHLLAVMNVCSQPILLYQPVGRPESSQRVFYHAMSSSKVHALFFCRDPRRSSRVWTDRSWNDVVMTSRATKGRPRRPHRYGPPLEIPLGIRVRTSSEPD